ncbi:MAG: RHS repeat-associated core domain-containing protein [Anaerolineaceae bacterium]
MFEPITARMGTLYFYADGQRIAMKKNGVVSCIYGDQLGSVSAVADSDGNLISETLYHPWGTTRYAQGISPTDYGYTGQMKEGDIYFYNARWYDPQLGRFMQADSIVPPTQGTQGFDRYAYINNNPMRYTDPTGHCPLLWFQLVRWSIVDAGAFFMNTTKEIIVQNNDAMNQQERDRIGGALVTELSEIINDEANRNNISADLIGAVIRPESGAFERHIFGPFANVAEAGEATFRNLFNKGSASIGIGQMQVATAKMLEENGYVNYGGNTISNLLDPEKAVGYVAGYLSYIRTNLVKEYGVGFTSLSQDEQNRVILQGYNMGFEELISQVERFKFSGLLRDFGYHRQTLDECRRWRLQAE